MLGIGILIGTQLHSKDYSINDIIGFWGACENNDIYSCQTIEISYNENDVIQFHQNRYATDDATSGYIIDFKKINKYEYNLISLDMNITNVDDENIYECNPLQFQYKLDLKNITNNKLSVDNNGIKLDYQFISKEKNWAEAEKYYKNIMEK